MAGCFCHHSSSVEPVCAVWNVSRRGDRGTVGIGAALASKTAGAGSSGLQSHRCDLLRAVRVSATARYWWQAETASAKGRAGTFRAAHHFGAGRGRQSDSDHCHSFRHQAESRCASTEYRGLVAEHGPAGDATRIDDGCRQPQAARASCNRRRARAGNDASQRPAIADAFAGGCSTSSGIGHRIFAHSAGTAGRDRRTSAKCGRRVAAQFGRHQHRALSSGCARAGITRGRTIRSGRQGADGAWRRRRFDGSSTRTFNSGQCGFESRREDHLARHSPRSVESGGNAVWKSSRNFCRNS